MIGIGLVGYGYWGSNLARNLVGVDARIVTIGDLRDDPLALAKARYSAVDLVSQWQDVIRNPNRCRCRSNPSVDAFPNCVE